jgi:thiol:disulfide interchange protein
MRKAYLIIGILITLVATSAFGSAQSSPKRRTPVLTSDDLGSSREVVGPLEETEAPTPAAETQPARGSIVWHRDVRRALEVARAEGKLVVVDVYTDWCGWCKKMDRTIYADPSIVALSRQEIFVKVNAEDGEQGQHFAEQMRVNGYPTTIILDSRGKVLNIAQGYIETPRAFGDLLREARTQAKQ